MVFTTAYAGIANIIPRTPDILPTANSRNRIVSGCISNVFPKTFGEMMFDSTCCTTNTTTQTNNAFVGETVNPIIAAGIKPMYGPRYGMMFVMAAVTPAGRRTEVDQQIPDKGECPDEQTYKCLPADVFGDGFIDFLEQR